MECQWCPSRAQHVTSFFKKNYVTSTFEQIKVGCGWNFLVLWVQIETSYMDKSTIQGKLNGYYMYLTHNFIHGKTLHLFLPAINKVGNFLEKKLQ